MYLYNNYLFLIISAYENITFLCIQSLCDLLITLQFLNFQWKFKGIMKGQKYSLNNELSALGINTDQILLFPNYPAWDLH